MINTFWFLYDFDNIGILFCSPSIYTFCWITTLTGWSHSPTKRIPTLAVQEHLPKFRGVWKV